MNKIILASALLASAAAFAADKNPQPFHREGWEVQPVAVPAGHSLAKVVEPSADGWKEGAFEKNPPQVEGATPGNHCIGDYSCWYRKKVNVPAEWKGRSVTLDLTLLGLNAVVRVNGKQAGVVLHPQGSVEISRLVNYGADNEVAVFVTNRGYGTGEGPVAYWGRDDQGWPALGQAYSRRPPIQLTSHTPARVTDVFLDCSWRKKQLEVTVELASAIAAKGELVFEVLEDNGRDPATRELVCGKTVRRVTQAVKLAPGTDKATFVVPWPDVVAWEPVRNPKVYDWRVRLTADGADCDVPAPGVFGFSELWREGKTIYLNGHPQVFRGCWTAMPDEEPEIMHDYGFNLNYCTHQHIAPFVEDPEEMERRTRAGVCKFTGMPPIYYCNSDKVRNDPNCTAQWRRYLELWARSCRNFPCVVGASCGVNMICPERNMRPEMLGQDHEDGGVAKNIEFAAAEARKLFPGCLYFSHADGTEADISSSNLYFNFTPLQEREEWLSQWAEKGTLPWYAAEFGAPYGACWFHARTPQYTEWLAAYYGEKAYRSETDEALEYAVEMAKICRRQIHGASYRGKGPWELNPLCVDYTRMLAYRTNRAWRNYGLNGGTMYLDQWKWDDDGWKRDAYSRANGDILCFIGGADDATDRTHAYWSGQEVRKSIVFRWDGEGENTLRAEWTFCDAKSGETVCSGKAEATLAGGTAKTVPIAFTVPEVTEKDRRRSFVLKAVFSAAHGMTRENPANWSCRTDSTPIDVYAPFKERKFCDNRKLALFDPEGETAKMLTALGQPFTEVDSLEAVATNRSFQNLIVGRQALSRTEGLEKLLAWVASGNRLAIMPQTAEVWQMLGFKVEDSMARVMRSNGLNYNGQLDDVDLNHWAGSPLAEKPYGNVMKHDTRRGPRWTHRFAVSAMPLLIPNRAGFVPLARGEFDLSYSACLRLAHGGGTVVFNAFDFEGRVGEGKCPAATRTAQAVLSAALTWRPRRAREVVTDGRAAARLAAALGVEATEYRADGVYTNVVFLVGSDSKVSPKELARHCELGDNRIGVFGCDRYVRELGGVSFAREITGAVSYSEDGRAATNLSTRLAYRLARPDDRVMGDLRRAGCHAGLVRFRDGFEASKLKLKDSHDQLWRLSETGYAAFYAGAKDAKGKPAVNTYIEMPDVFSVCDRYREIGFKTEALRGQGWGSAPKDDKDLLLRNAAESEDNSLRRWALLLDSWNVRPGEAVVRRSLYTRPYEQFEPLAQYNVLGPFPCPKGDNSEYMVDTVDFPVDKNAGGMPGRMAEEMAIAGDVQPNPRFHPEGLAYLDSTPRDLRFLDWRPVVKSAPDGHVDLREVPLIAAQSFQTSYAVGFLSRETDGEITLRFGVDWRGKVWVNGKEVAKTYGGTKDEGSIIVKDIPVFAKPDLSGEALQAFDKEHGTFDGRNVISVKVGSGMSAAAFYLNVTREARPGEVRRTVIPELKDVDLYESANPGFDPYEYVYW